MRRISLFIVINAISLYIVSVLMKSVYIGSLASLITLTIMTYCRTATPHWSTVR